MRKIIRTSISVLVIIGFLFPSFARAHTKALMSISDFKTDFFIAALTTSSKNRLDDNSSKITETGALNSILQISANEFCFFLLTIPKGTEDVTGISLFGAGNGSIESGTAIILTLCDLALTTGAIDEPSELMSFMNALNMTDNLTVGSGGQAVINDKIYNWSISSVLGFNLTVSMK